jgi:bacterioferritin
MEKQAIIDLLNKDIEDEHGAIIQYLEHAYAMGEGEMACEIEAMARDEMRHLDWLAETVVALGGRPSLERGKMIPGGRTVADWMANNVQLEQGAIDQYREHIKLIDDDNIKRLLQRIISDEEAHHGDFAHFVDKAGKHEMQDIRGDRQDSTTEVLDWGIEHEYTVILQYLLHSYTTPDAETRRQMEDQAINEMQHLGWLAEELVDGGGRPRLEHTKVDHSTGTADMLRADIAIEREVADKYDRSARETNDPDIRKLLLRIRDNELYHLDVFNDLLKKED